MKNLFTLSLLMLSVNVFSQTSDSAVTFYQKGLEEKTAKRWLVASTYFDHAIKLNSNFTDAYLENGYVNLEMRKTDAAKQYFIKVNELDPGNPKAGKELMELYFAYHQYQNTIDFAAKCKSCANADKYTALSYYQLEDYVTTEKLLLKLIQKNPADAELNYTLGRTYVEMELEKKAIPFYTKAVQLDPSKGTWFFELGLLLYNTGNFKNAIVYFNNATEKGFPESLAFNENLGYSYIFNGEFEKGEKLLLSISDKKKGNKDILRDLAKVYFDHKDYDKSLDFCQKLMEMDIKDGKALYMAGMCFQKKGQKERGQQMCDKAIEIDPELNSLRQKKMSVGM